MTEHFDIIIIGTGAGGGTLLRRLAPSGLKILVLERGEFLPRESQNWDQHDVASGRYQTTETWLDSSGAEFRPYTHYWVGGNTKVYGAALLRFGLTLLPAPAPRHDPLGSAPASRAFNPGLRAMCAANCAS